MLSSARRRTHGALLLAALAAAAYPARAQAPPESLASIDALNCDLVRGQARISFRVEGALGPKTIRDLDAGAVVSFVHTMTLRKRGFLWFHRTLASATVEVTAKLDTLTQQYTLTRRIGERPAETRTTDDREEMERWMEDVKDLEMPLPPDSGTGSVLLKVRTDYQKTFLLFFMPWSQNAIREVECR